MAFYVKDKVFFIEVSQRMMCHKVNDKFLFFFLFLKELTGGLFRDSYYGFHLVIIFIYIPTYIQ